MKDTFYVLFILSALLTGCNKSKEISLGDLLEGSPFIEGKAEYLTSPYVTAGDRVYMVGHQDGTFPELGWHIKGEMGGIWDHPIKLMDGFEAEFVLEDKAVAIDKADAFVNYPFANAHFYSFDDQNLRVVRRQFVPDHKEGIIVQFELENTAEADRDLTFRFKGHADLRPTWLGERTQMTDGEDDAVFKDDSGYWLVKDKNNPWFVAFGSDETPATHQNEESSYSGNGASGSLTYAVSIPAKGTKVLTFTIAGSYTSETEALATYNAIQKNPKADVQQKKLRYKALANRSKLTIPDEKMQQTFEWLKYNCDWLVRTVPEIGSGITAGIPDYPWWFGVDSEYALKGYMAIGQQDAVYNTIKLLDSVSDAVNGNGRIIHEMSTNGVVFNEGNINETPQFASLIWEIYRWNGDREFLEAYFPTIKKGLDWLMTEKDTDKNLFPDGFGMMEIHGLDSEMIDVAAYTQRAFDDTAKMAAELGDTALEAQYSDIAAQLKAKINTEFWSEEFQSYADFIGTDEQALHLIEDAIIRADTLKKPWAVAELQQTKQAILANPSATPRPFVLHHNWVVNTPMEMQIADPEKALKALKTAEKFVNPFGVFVTGIDRDASAGSDEGSFKGSKLFSYTGAVMTLPTGVQAVAESNYGRPDKALNYLNRMTRTFSYALPGSMYEVSPDYGMIVQAWNIYSFAVPIVQQFFGIRPDAARQKIVIAPQMPEAWREASLENVTVADNEISVFYNRSGKKTVVMVTQKKPEWTLEIVLPKSETTTYDIGNSAVEVLESENEIRFISKSTTVELALH